MEMSSALKPAHTSSGPQNPTVPPQMNKPMHPQGGSVQYGQQNLVNLSHNNPNPAHALSHNSNPHQWPINMNSFQTSPQASSHPVASNHPQPHLSMSYSPPKNPAFSQVQHNVGIPTTQSLPANQAPSATTPASEPERPQSNGTADVMLNKPEQNHVTTPKKENLQSPEKAKTSTDKSPFNTATSSENKIETKTVDQVEEAEIPENVNQALPAIASTTTAVSPSAPTSAATSTKENVPAIVPTTSLPSQSSTNLLSASCSPQNGEPSVASTVESSTTGSASAPTNAATTSETTTTPSTTPQPDEIETDSSLNEETTSKEEEKKQDVVPEEVKELKVEPVEPVTTKSAPKSTAIPKTPSRKAKMSKTDVDSPKSSKTTSPPDVKPLPNKFSPAGGKIKRNRIRTQPYQSPLPELEIITKMTSISTPKSKTTDEKLIIFYKSEFLAVRNPEGSFYICQAMQNVYKSSPKIRIRWLSQDKNLGEIYTPDFYDYTDFDCILTNLYLTRVDKGKYKLPPKERERTDNILKRAIAVEKGESTSLDDSLTEDNPDGLDVSLYKDEDQIKKRKGAKRKASKSKTRGRTVSPSAKKSTDEAKICKIELTPEKTNPTKKPVASIKKATSGTPADVKKSAANSRTERAKRRGGSDSTPTKRSPIVDQKKAKVIAKVTKRTAVPSPKILIAAKSATKVKPLHCSPSTSKAKQPAKPATPVATRPVRTPKRTTK